MFEFLRRPANHAALLEPVEDGTRVTETFDMSTAKFPPALRVMGYPKRHERNVAASVRNLVAQFASS